MLKHGRAGVPLEVMGLMLGEFVDEYTVKASCRPACLPRLAFDPLSSAPFNSQLMMQLGCPTIGYCL